MERLTCVQIEKDNQEHYRQAAKLWLPYMEEIGINQGCLSSREQILQDLRNRTNIQGNRTNMHFEIYFEDDEPIGIAFFAVDTGGISGILEGGYGCVMEFYVFPERRRQGFGGEIMRHIERAFRSHGVTHIYLTPDPVTGEPFWLATGFSDSGKIDPDNKLPIYIKKI